MDYSQEPEVVYAPLSEADYCEFYDNEMAAFTDDASFYRSHLNTTDAVLELGCGTGRLTHLLADYCQSITGIDISAEMIRRARAKKCSENVVFHTLDMSHFQLDQLFDAIIIPYNTLNLLGDAETVSRCLEHCRNHLAEQGKLLLHLYHPNDSLHRNSGKKLFQFAFLPQQDATRTLIKETLRIFDTDQHKLTMEERYRVRILNQPAQNRDLHHHLTLYVPSLTEWKNILVRTGFSAMQYWGGYDAQLFSQKDDSLLLIHANPAEQ